MTAYLKNFVKYFGLLLIIFNVVNLSANAAIIDDIKKSIETKQEEIRELEKQANEFQQTVRQKEKTAKTLDEAIDILDSQIGGLELAINISERQIEKTELSIRELVFKINEKAIEIKETKQKIGEILRALYEAEDEELLELILQYNNFSDFFNQIRYAENLQNSLQEKLDILKTLKLKLEIDKQNVEKEKENLENHKNNLKAEQNILSSKRAEKNSLLVKTRRDEKKYRQLLSEVNKKRVEIQKEILELEDKLRFIIDPSTIPAPRSGVLAWPSNGILTQKYGPTSETGFLNNAYKFHNGIDIAKGLGSSIAAAKNGIIKAIGDNGEYAYGKWVAIEHENGLTTLYAHLSLIVVKPGQKIKQGQVIGYEGSTGFSTGSHLHFTVYATNTFMTEQRWFGLLPLGGHIDPMKYL